MFPAWHTPTTTADTAISSLAVVNAAGQITDQGSAITLRSAVIAVNPATSAAGSANTIILGAGTYVLTIPGTGETASAGNALIGDLDVLAPTSGRNTLTVQGAGAGVTTIQQTTGIDRIFDVHPVNLAGTGCRSRRKRDATARSARSRTRKSWRIVLQGIKERRA